MATVSQLTFRAGAEFIKTVAISPVATGPGECAGTDCVTAYNVQFEGDTGGAVVEITVVMSKAHSTPPGHAVVFIDGVALTAICGATISEFSDSVRQNHPDRQRPDAVLRLVRRRPGLQVPLTAPPGHPGGAGRR